MIVIAALLLAGAVVDQPAARSPREMVCALTGDCGGAPGGERPRRPCEASFDATGIADRSMEAQFTKLRAARARIATVTASR